MNGNDNDSGTNTVQNSDDENAPASNIRSKPSENGFVPDEETFARITDPANRKIDAVPAPDYLAGDDGLLRWDDYGDSVTEVSGHITGLADEAAEIVANAAADPEATVDALDEVLPDPDEVVAADGKAKAQERILKAASIRENADAEMDPETLRWLDRDELDALWTQTLVDAGIVDPEEVPELEVNDAAGNGSAGGAGADAAILANSDSDDRTLNVNAIRERAKGGPRSVGTMQDYRNSGPQNPESPHQKGADGPGTMAGHRKRKAAEATGPDPAPDTLYVNGRPEQKGSKRYFQKVARMKRRDQWPYRDPDGYADYRAYLDEKEENDGAPPSGGRSW